MADAGERGGGWQRGREGLGEAKEEFGEKVVGKEKEEEGGSNRRRRVSRNSAAGGVSARGASGQL